MSVWTNVCGSLRLNGKLYEKNKETSDEQYFPFPDEQINVMMPLPWLNGESPVLKFKVVECNLPLVEAKIKPLLANLPSGEHKIISYTLSQDMEKISGGSYEPTLGYQEKHVIAEKIRKLYNSQPSSRTRIGDWIVEHNQYHVSTVEYVDEVVLSINDNIRNCTAKHFLGSMEQFIHDLNVADICALSGYIEWSDGELSEYRCAIRVSDRIISFLILDSQSNKIITSKVYRTVYAYDNNLGQYTRIVSVAEDDSWKTFKNSL